MLSVTLDLMSLSTGVVDFFFIFLTNGFYFTVIRGYTSLFSTPCAPLHLLPTAKAAFSWAQFFVARFFKKKNNKTKTKQKTLPYFRLQVPTSWPSFMDSLNLFWGKWDDSPPYPELQGASVEIPRPACFPFPAWFRLHSPL